mmetsp:Transcript_6560/g.12410  ORF Transcript_6560/g.12410 Transcript_6560/m.12410 type:complete len:263 (+) Transcript_6560:174-962(+)
MINMHSIAALSSIALLLLPHASVGFSPQQQQQQQRRRRPTVIANRGSIVPTRLRASPPEVGSTSSEPTASGGAPTSTTAATTVFPVLRRISGHDWVGDCRYVDAALRPVADLRLTGGIRYDLDTVNSACTMSSYLEFPNGQSRRVEMAGFQTANSPVTRLEAVEEGPIYMTVSELYPDTVLVNEVETMSGKVVMTTSLSVVNGGEELVMVSHEVGSDGMLSATIDGHQIWRLKKAKKEDRDTEGDKEGVTKDNEMYRGTTGR